MSEVSAFLDRLDRAQLEDAGKTFGEQKGLPSRRSQERRKK